MDFYTIELTKTITVSVEAESAADAADLAVENSEGSAYDGAWLWADPVPAAQAEPDEELLAEWGLA
jgi:hypothetical protein